MKINRRTGYAIDAVEFIAHSKKEKVKAKEIVAECKIPEYYLYRVLGDLARHGVLTSNRGCNGGFSLNPDITLFDVFMAIEGRDFTDNKTLSVVMDAFYKTLKVFRCRKIHSVSESNNGL